MKTHELYSGKAKTIYQSEQADCYVMHFRDDATAFDGEKKAVLACKGLVNNQFNAFIMDYLNNQGIATHFKKRLNANESLVMGLDMILVESVLRNYAAGSLCRRLGITEGQHLSPPLQEFFYKDDALHDPLINDAHITTFGWANQDEITQMRMLTLKINEILTPLFEAAGLMLVDYKLEFGRHDGRLILGDEFTLDGCRIWDSSTKEKLDKDRFRHDLGDTISAYAQVAQRLGITIEQ